MAVNTITNFVILPLSEVITTLHYLKQLAYFSKIPLTSENTSIVILCFHDKLLVALSYLSYILVKVIIHVDAHQYLVPLSA